MSELDLTRNQALVFDALRDADQPMSAYTILDKLRDAGFRAPLQVYRALEKLIEKGLVHRLESINAFVACAHPHDNCAAHGLTAFAICERCSQVIEFHDHAIEHRLADWAKGRGFQPTKTLIEVKGICAACAAA